VEEVRYTYKIIDLIPREETIGRPGNSFKSNSKTHLGEIRDEGVGFWDINGLRLKAENYLVILVTITNHTRLWSVELVLLY
jgi:hypothetical protein